MNKKIVRDNDGDCTARIIKGESAKQAGLENLKMHTLQFMVFSFLLASVTSVIIGIINNHTFLSFIPHIFVLIFYPAILLYIKKNKKANVKRLSIISLAIYSFILYSGAWYELSFSHPLISVLSVFLLVMMILLFEGKCQRIFVMLFSIMIAGMFIYDVASLYKVDYSHMKEHIIEGIAFGIPLIMVVACVGAFKKKFIEMNSKLYLLSITDPLTGAINTRRLNEIVKELKNEFKENNSTFSLAIIDLDNFKCINDTCGHEAGDIILKDLVEVMQNNLRDVDILSRYGGDEFVVVIPNSKATEAKEIVERLLISIRSLKHDCEFYKISFSAGVADIDEANDLNIDIFKLADSRLYFSKHDGKDKVTASKHQRDNMVDKIDA